MRYVQCIYSLSIWRVSHVTLGKDECPHLRLWRSESAAERLLQRVQEGLDLVQALVAPLWRPESHDVEVLEDLLEAWLAHFEGDAPVAEEARAPDAEHRLAAVHTGRGDKAQKGLDLLGCDRTPAFVRAKALLELLGIHVSLDDHVLDAIVRDEELEEVQGCGGGWHLLSRAWIEGKKKVWKIVMEENGQIDRLRVPYGLTPRHNHHLIQVFKVWHHACNLIDLTKRKISLFHCKTGWS